MSNLMGKIRKAIGLDHDGPPISSAAEKAEALNRLAENQARFRKMGVEVDTRTAATLTDFHRRQGEHQ